MLPTNIREAPTCFPGMGHSALGAITCSGENEVLSAIARRSPRALNHCVSRHDEVLITQFLNFTLSTWAYRPTAVSFGLFFVLTSRFFPTKKVARSVRSRLLFEMKYFVKQEVGSKTDLGVAPQK